MAGDRYDGDVGLRLGPRWLCMFDTADEFMNYSEDAVQEEVDAIIEHVLGGFYDRLISEALFEFPRVRD